MENGTHVSRHPLDFESLQPGSVITIPELERILMCKKGTDNYAFGVLSLRKQIIAELSRINRPCSVRSKHGTLEILDAPQSSQYENNRFVLGIRKLRRALKQMLQVPINRLTTEQRIEHDRNLTTNSRTFQGAMMGRRGQLKLKEHIGPQSKLLDE